MILSESNYTFFTLNALSRHAGAKSKSPRNITDVTFSENDSDCNLYSFANFHEGTYENCFFFFPSFSSLSEMRRACRKIFTLYARA